MFVVQFQNMFHAGQPSTKGTGLGMYGATLDYKVHSKLYTIQKMLSSGFRSFSVICFYETK